MHQPHDQVASSQRLWPLAELHFGTASSSFSCPGAVLDRVDPASEGLAAGCHGPTRRAARLREVILQQTSDTVRTTHRDAATLVIYNYMFKPRVFGTGGRYIQSWCNCAPIIVFSRPHGRAVVSEVLWTLWSDCGCHAMDDPLFVFWMEAPRNPTPAQAAAQACTLQRADVL